MVRLDGRGVETVFRGGKKDQAIAGLNRLFRHCRPTQADEHLLGKSSLLSSPKNNEIG